MGAQPQRGVEAEAGGGGAPSRPGGGSLSRGSLRARSAEGSRHRAAARTKPWAADVVGYEHVGRGPQARLGGGPGTDARRSPRAPVGGYRRSRWARGRGAHRSEERRVGKEG